VDFHAEATSEKQAMGWYLNGRVSAVVGTHTHVGTVDARVLPGGTAYVSDVGMTGPRDSVIGSETGAVLERFLTGLPQRLTVADGPVAMNSVLIDVDQETGQARSIERIDRVVE
jgi:calcineurin-like phosphoesterase